VTGPLGSMNSETAMALGILLGAMATLIVLALAYAIQRTQTLNAVHQEQHVCGGTVVPRRARHGKLFRGRGSLQDAGEEASF
jgi:hypothetical protein